MNVMEVSPLGPLPSTGRVYTFLNADDTFNAPEFDQFSPRKHPHTIIVTLYSEDPRFDQSLTADACQACRLGTPCSQKIKDTEDGLRRSYSRISVSNEDKTRQDFSARSLCYRTREISS